MNKMSERVKEVTDNSFEREVLQANKPVLVEF
jgi:thioredoxin-like negative regulator of GroEL